MRTAVDTNILSALWSKEPAATGGATLLGEAKQSGAVIISGVVYAELLAYPGATEAFVNQFCDDTGITIDFAFGRDVWLDAGKRFAKYANQRRKTQGKGPRRLLADFLIGSHALHQADRLMTLDAGRYKLVFQGLPILTL